MGVILGTRRMRGSRGAAAVEFALIVPILIVLVFGIISYGLMLSFRQSVSQAAAEGIRAAVVTPNASADQRQTIAFAAVKDAMGVDCNKPTGYLHCETSTPADCPTCMSVTVTYDYKADPSKVKLIYGFALPDKLTFTSTAQVNGS